MDVVSEVGAAQNPAGEPRPVLGEQLASRADLASDRFWQDLIGDDHGEDDDAGDTDE